MYNRKVFGSLYKMKVFITLLTLFVTTQLVTPQHFLLMQPIQNAVKNGDFSGFKTICKEKISINLEKPFFMNGYFYSEKFIDDFCIKFSEYKTQRIEWSSKQIEVDFAIQSLNLALKNKKSGRIVLYKLIFFMTRDKEWKLYYLRGLRI